MPNINITSGTAFIIVAWTSPFHTYGTFFSWYLHTFTSAMCEMEVLALLLLLNQKFWKNFFPMMLVTMETVHGTHQAIQ